MINSKRILKELGWFALLLGASYLFISARSSFDLFDQFYVCRGASIVLANIVVIFQLALLLFITRQLLNFIMQMEDEKWRLRLLPIVVFAFPVSVIIIWYQFVGC